MYESVKSCVRVNSTLSECFDSFNGDKQGEPLSPMLFLFFINDLYSHLYSDDIDPVVLDNIVLFLLMFADDTVLISHSKEGLQKLLDNLYIYCSSWGIQVNIGKTVVMVCKKGNIVEDLNLQYNNCKSNVVTKFTYLGVTLTSNGCFFQAQQKIWLHKQTRLFFLFLACLTPFQ